MPEAESGLNLIYKHINYPNRARQNNVEGRVFIKFIVDENGNVKSPEILKDIGSGCGKAAIEGSKKVKFILGAHNVKVYFTPPVNFKLQN
ncbi:MAG: energy transducer TonB [Gracilimonas sp.]